MRTCQRCGLPNAGARRCSCGYDFFLNEILADALVAGLCAITGAWIAYEGTGVESGGPLLFFFSGAWGTAFGWTGGVNRIVAGGVIGFLIAIMALGALKVVKKMVPR